MFSTVWCPVQDGKYATDFCLTFLGPLIPHVNPNEIMLVHSLAPGMFIWWDEDQWKVFQKHARKRSVNIS